jgi:hypothetical protein
MKRKIGVMGPASGPTIKDPRSPLVLGASRFVIP